MWSFSLSEHLDYFKFFLEFCDKIRNFFAVLRNSLSLAWLRSYMVFFCNLLFQRTIFRHSCSKILLKINSEIRILACLDIFFSSRFPCICGDYSFENSGIFSCFTITKEHFEKKLKKHDKVTVYSPENIPLDISKEFYISRDGTTIEFEMDCEDLALYCKRMGMQLTPNK